MPIPEPSARSNVFYTVLVLAVVLGLGLFAWSVFQPLPEVPEASPAARPQASKPPPAIAAPAPPASRPPPPRPDETPQFLADQEKLHQIIIIEESNSAKVNRLLAALPTLGAESQVYGAQHICNLAEDSEFGKIRRAMFVPGVTQEAAEVIYSDALNRPVDVLLPTLLEVARTPGNPLQQEAFDTLTFMTDANHGQDWNAWTVEITKKIQEEKQNQR